MMPGIALQRTISRATLAESGEQQLIYLLLEATPEGAIAQLPLLDFVAATSVGKVGDSVLLDLRYDEDSVADVDMNVVKTGRGRFIELQGTAEHTPFDDAELVALMTAADKGIRELIALQKKALGDVELLKEK